MKKLPIGISEFSEIVKDNYYYVDKTLLIKDIIDLPGKVKLITRPRRFGKTLNMRMLEHFFSLEGEEGLFDELKIWKEQALVRDYYHKYPVIFITFKNIKNLTWKEAYENMKRILAEVALKHIRRIEDEEIKESLQKVSKGKATVADYANTLKLLTEGLYLSTEEKVVLLIDEYDVPIEAAYTYRNKDSEYYDNMVAFMRNLLTAALKDNEYLEFGVLTGVYRIAKESIFSGLNNLMVFTVFDNLMSDKFGFTEGEVREILSYYNLTSEDKEIIDKWYGNYKIGKVQNLYNPWSIINYIASRVEGGLTPKEAIRKYWVDTSENRLIIEQVEINEEIKTELDELLQGKEIVASVNPSLSLREMEEDETAVWVLFANSGYLNARWIDIERYAFWIPNEEIMMFFKESVLRWINKKTHVRMKKLYDYLDKMLRSGIYESFIKGLKNFLENGLSYYDVAKDEAERFYKGFLLGMLAVSINGFIVESEQESGYGRLDVVVYPKEKRYGEYAAIFEVKRADDESKLEEKAKEALNQIKERNYYAKMASLGYKVIGFGIAFCGKKMALKVEKL